MNSKFFSECNITAKELQEYSQVIANYENNQTDEDKLVISLLNNAINERNNNAATSWYDKISNVLKGDVLFDGLGDLFSIMSSSNNDAFVIMNNKASIFDISSINVELKPTKNYDNIDGSKENIIDLVNRIINETYLKRPQFKFAVADAIKYSRAYPIAVTLIGWDDNAILGNGTNFTGDLTCETIPIENFYWDPSSIDIDTIEYCAISKMLPYPKIQAFIEKLKNSDANLMEALYVTNNAQEVKTQSSSSFNNNLYLVKNGSVELNTLYRKIRENNKVKIKLYHIINSKYIVATQIYDIPYIPVSILKESAAPSSFLGVSSVMLALPYIRQKCFLENVMNEIVLGNKSPTYVVSQNSGIDAKTLIDLKASDGAKVLTCLNDNPSSAVSVLETPQITADMIRLRDDYVAEINKAIGSSDMSNLNSKLSGAAAQTVVNQLTISENNSVIELEKYLVRFVSIMLSFIRTKLSKKPKETNLDFRAETQKDTDDVHNKGYEIISITPDEFEQVYADVVIDASLLRTSKQQKQQQDLMTLYQMQAQYFGKADVITLKDIVNSLSIPNKQAILERIESNDEANKQQQALNLVQGVLNLLQNPEAQGLDVEQATMMVLNQLQQRGGN